MVQRICPICDRVMKTAHYCGNCRQRIRYPHVRNVTYYLNEQHPQDESGCSYHDMDSQRIMKAEHKAMVRPLKSAEPGGAGKQPASPGMYASPDGVWKPAKLSQSAPFPTRQLLPPLGTAHQTGRTGMREDRRLRAGSKAVLGIFLVSAVFSIFSLFSGQMADMVSSVPVEYDIDLGDYTGEEPGIYDQGMSKDDVIALGESCNTRGHFSVQGEQMEQPVLNILQGAGFQIARKETHSYNEAYDDGETWFTTWTSIEVTGETQDSYQYVELDFDTGTGELHEISLSLEDPERLAAVTCAILAALAEEGELPADAACFTLVADGLPGALESGNGYRLLEGAVLIEGISYEKSYSVYISHNMDSDL